MRSKEWKKLCQPISSVRPLPSLLYTYINQSSMVQGYPGVLPAHATAAAQRAYRKHVAGGGDQPSRPLPLGS